jgi:hypothetical protein
MEVLKADCGSSRKNGQDLNPKSSEPFLYRAVFILPLILCRKTDTGRNSGKVTHLGSGRSRI